MCNFMLGVLCAILCVLDLYLACTLEYFSFIYALLAGLMAYFSFTSFMAAYSETLDE